MLAEEDATSVSALVGVGRGSGHMDRSGAQFHGRVGPSSPLQDFAVRPCTST